jgi:hypothetical protein
MNLFEAVNVRDEVGSVLDPMERAMTAEADMARATATRLASLDGQTLAVVDNGTNPRFRERLVQRLQAMFAFEEVMVVIKDTVNVPPRAEDWQEITKRGTAGLALYGA